MINAITRCRICKNSHLVCVLDLGMQAMTGVFPRSHNIPVERMPVELVKCTGQGCCGLVQLRHSGAPDVMYGEGYGYRSALNASMVRHLEDIVAEIEARGVLRSGDIVLDIGSNDATLLRSYANNAYRLIGIDPSAEPLRPLYPPGSSLIADFFTAERFKEMYGVERAKIITSIAMFYDLPDPQQFVRDIADTLADDGLWVLEQSYLPTMLAMNAYDTVCQEHLEYYATGQIAWLLERADLQAVDVSLNDTNGGSFRVTVAKRTNPAFVIPSPACRALLNEEARGGIDQLPVYEQFRERVLVHRGDLRRMLECLHAAGKKVFGLGASTKGNVLLQWCGITPEDLPCIAEVNSDKFGCFTPGTHIPIVSQSEADARLPDVYLVLPWHFRNGIVRSMRPFLERGGSLLFPLPAIEIVTARDL